MFDAGGPDEASINHDHELFQHLDDDVEMVVGGDHQVTKEPYMTTLAILDARCDVDAMERAIRKHIGESFASIMEDSMGMEVYLVGSERLRTLFMWTSEAMRDEDVDVNDFKDQFVETRSWQHRVGRRKDGNRVWTRSYAAKWTPR